MELKSLIIIFNLSLITICNCEKILFIAPLGGKSHHNFYSGITEGLSKNGHKVS